MGVVGLQFLGETIISQVKKSKIPQNIFFSRIDYCNEKNIFQQLQNYNFLSITVQSLNNFKTFQRFCFLHSAEKLLILLDNRNPDTKFTSSEKTTLQLFRDICKKLTDPMIALFQR